MLMKLMLSIFTFFLLYYPPIWGINTLLPIGGISWIYLLTHAKLISKSINIRKLIMNYLLWSIVCLWMGVVILTHAEGWGNMAGPVYWLVIIIPACLTLTMVIKNNGFDIYYLFDLLLMVGIVQSLLSIITFLSPSIKYMITKVLLEQNAIDEIAYTYAYEHRFYGYASGLTFGMPVIQAFLAMIALYLSVYKNAKYFLYVPLLALSAIINARSAIIIFGICGFVFVLLKGKNRKNIALRYFCFLFVLAMMSITGIIFVGAVAPQTYQWIITGVKEILSTLLGKIQEGYFSYVTDAEHLMLPNGIGFWLGVGARTLGGNRYEIYSDIGYVNDIWFGGIFYCIVSYLIIFYYLYGIRSQSLKRAERETKILRTYLRWSFTISLIILNIKMYLISLNGFSTLFLLFVIFITFENKAQRTLKEINIGANEDICYYTSI